MQTQGENMSKTTENIVNGYNSDSTNESIATVICTNSQVNDFFLLFN